MSGCEELFALLRAERIAFWVDWGTLLGLVRHGNVIPWDYDADLCLLEPDYLRLQSLFAEAGGRRGSLVLDCAAYGDPRGCGGLTFADWDPAELGIDLVAYQRGEAATRSLMNGEVLAEYPGDYDILNDDLYPIAPRLLLGGPVGTPQRTERRVRDLFGPDWRRYPDGQRDSRLTAPPGLEVGRIPREDGPWIARGADPRARGGEVWWLAPEEPRTAARTFTEIVFADDLRLWGRLAVAVLEPGDVLQVPPGWWSLRAEGGGSQRAEARALRT